MGHTSRTRCLVVENPCAGVAAVRIVHVASEPHSAWAETTWQAACALQVCCRGLQPCKKANSYDNAPCMPQQVHQAPVGSIPFEVLAAWGVRLLQQRAMVGALGLPGWLPVFAGVLLKGTRLRVRGGGKGNLAAPTAG